MELWLERSSLADRVIAPEVAFDFHVETFARWLRNSGAEGRLALVYLSGPAARHALLAGLNARRLRTVETPARLGTPVHPTLAAHQGDHFNDLLHVVDGLDCESPTRLLREIGLEISTYRRVATWAAVLVEGPEALAALEVAGGILRRHAQRRFVFLSAEDAPRPTETAALPEEMLESWRQSGRVTELAYALAWAPGTAPTYLDFARLVRTGYAGLPLNGSAHSDLAALRSLWAEPPRSSAALLPWLARPSAAVAELIGRHGDAPLLGLHGETSLAMALVGEPGGRFAAHLPSRDVPVFTALAEARSAADAGRSFSPATRSTLEAAVETAWPNLRVHLHLALAAGAFVAEDVEGAAAALTDADDVVTAEGLSVGPELAFEVIEKQTGVQAFLGQRGEARAGLDRLGELLPRLHSPFYTARHALARGEQMRLLDPGRAREILREAGMLFDAHGYASWAQTARAVAE